MKSAVEKVLLVCSGGGHLRQLHGFAERIGYPPERQLWVTFRNGLSESLLADRQVVYAPFTGPRDFRNFAKLVSLAGRVFSDHPIAEAVSTGSSPAVAFLPRAASRGIPAHYIESAARADSPSLSGRIISRDKRIQTYCQYPSWSNDRWAFRGSIFDEFVAGDVRSSAAAKPRRAVVSVGTQEGYPFRRFFDAVVPLLADYDEVLYQTGDCDISDLGIDGRSSVPHADLRTAVAEADVVITHAGVGAALTALEQGKHPILIPRSVKRGEHVDDHQQQVARELERRELATVRTPDTLAAEDLAFAAARGAVAVVPPPLRLG